MELYCEKYKEKIPPGKACCFHPTEYCKFRNACLPYFLGKEDARSSENKGNPDRGPEDDIKPA